MASDNRRSIPLLDLSCLRSFVAVADLGSISAAAAVVHLSQSAISLQVQRLEDQLGQQLFARHSRGVSLTVAGERLVAHARSALAANRRAVIEVSGAAGARPIHLGVPHDVLNPFVPAAMRRFAEMAPTREVVLETGLSRDLRDRLARGELDVVLSTEFEVPEGARPIASRQVGWVGARGSRLGGRRPLPLAFTPTCIFRSKALAVLEDAGIRFVLAVESGDVRAVEAAVAADLGIHAMIVEELPPGLEMVGAEAGLPPLPPVKVNLQIADAADPDLVRLGDALESVFAV